MLIQRINRTDPERAFLVVRNDQGSTVGRGRPLSFNMDGTRNGVDTHYCDAVTDQPLLAGLAHADISDGDYGLAQAYGYDDDAVLVKTNTAIAVGNVLAVLSASTALRYKTTVADLASVIGFFAAAESFASVATSDAATTRAKVFIRLL